MNPKNMEHFSPVRKVDRDEERTFITTEYLVGTDIAAAVRDAGMLSAKAEMPVRFNFNGLEITVKDKEC